MIWPKVINGFETLSSKYATTDQVDDTIQAINDAKDESKPYFIWLAFSTPHSYRNLPSQVTRENRRFFYAAKVESMDTEIGRLMQSVDLENTTVIFIGDNGTPAEARGPQIPNNHTKGKFYEISWIIIYSTLLVTQYSEKSTCYQASICTENQPYQ